MYYRIGLDTNILFSGLRYGGMAGKVIGMVEQNKCLVYLSEYIRDEFIAVSNRNDLPLNAFNKFLQLENVKIMTDASYYDKQLFKQAKKLIRDKKDIPVYAFAKKLIEDGRIDYFISGDKDLLTEEVRISLNSKIISLAEFLEKII